MFGIICLDKDDCQMDSYSSIQFHRTLLRDAVRTRAYQKSIARVVSPGDVVLDLGSGSGVLAMFACQAGAARVYAVERTDVILAAQRLAQANGMAERIQFVHGDAEVLQLPEKVDVIVSELISKAVLGQRMEALLLAAKKRLLKPQGKMLPQSVELCVAPIEASEKYSLLEFPPSAAYGIDFSGLRDLAFNNTESGRFRARNLLAPPQAAYRFEAHASKRPGPRQRLSFLIRRKAVLHGFCAWFSAILYPGITINTAPPGLPSWDNLFFPLLHPAELARGTTIELNLKGTETPDGVIWHWETVVKGPQGISGRYRQSTFWGSPVSRQTVARNSLKYKPLRSRWGEIEQSILSLCDGTRNLREIASQLRLRYGKELPSQRGAETAVRRILNDMAIQGALDTKPVPLTARAGL